MDSGCVGNKIVRVKKVTKCSGDVKLQVVSRHDSCTTLFC